MANTLMTLMELLNKPKAIKNFMESGHNVERLISEKEMRQIPEIQKFLKDLNLNKPQLEANFSGGRNHLGTQLCLSERINNKTRNLVYIDGDLNLGRHPGLYFNAEAGDEAMKVNALLKEYSPDLMHSRLNIVTGDEDFNIKIMANTLNNDQYVNIKANTKKLDELGESTGLFKKIGIGQGKELSITDRLISWKRLISCMYINTVQKILESYKNI